MMPSKGNALSRNPNMCASCSSMADGMADPDSQAGKLPDVQNQSGSGKTEEVGELQSAKGNG